MTEIFGLPRKSIRQPRKAVGAHLAVVAQCAVLFAGLSAGAAFADTDILVNQDVVPVSASGPAGGTFLYKVIVKQNTGTAASGVKLADTLPIGALLQSVVASPDGSCTPALAAGTPITLSNQTVECDLGALAMGATKTVTFEVILPSVSTNWTNFAKVTRTETDSDPSNDQLTRRITTSDAADLGLTVVTDPLTPSGSPLAPGQPYKYRVDVNNSGPTSIPATGRVEVSFSVPTGAAFTKAGGTNGWTCTPAATNAAPLIFRGSPEPAIAVTCAHAGALASGSTVPSLVIVAAPNVIGSISTSFSVKGFKQAAEALPDGQLTNNTKTANVQVSGDGSDVSLKKEVSGSATLAVGDQVTYTLTPRLNGGLLLTDVPVRVVDTLDAKLTYVSATGTGWSCTDAEQTVTCNWTGDERINYTDLPPITLTATVGGIGTVPNNGTVSLTGRADPVSSNDTTPDVFITSTNLADLRIRKTSSTYLNGQSVAVAINTPYQYTLSARNLGPLAVPTAGGLNPKIVITDSVPAGVTLQSLSSGTGWACSTTLPLVGPGSFSCERSDGLGKNIDTPSIVVNAVRTTSGIATNNACVTFDLAATGSTRVDDNGDNNCQGVGVGASDQTPGSEVKADLSVNKSVNKTTVAAGDLLTYTMIVTNAGSSPATKVNLRDVLGSLVSSAGSPGIASVVASQGTCSPGASSNVPSATLSCELGTLASGGAATVTVAVRPSVEKTGQRVNTATAYSADVVDTDLGNNTGTVSSEVTARVDLVASKTASPFPTAIAGAPIDYVVRAKNNGPSSAENVTLTDELTGDAVLIGDPVPSAGGTCALIPQPTGNFKTLSCTWGTNGASQFLANTGQREVKYTLRSVGAWTADQQLSNEVTIGTKTDEPDLSNNKATALVTLSRPQLDVLVSMGHSAEGIDLGAETTYTITVKNGGPSFATNVVMTDTFPLVDDPVKGSSSATFSYTGGLTVDKGGVCTSPAADATSGAVVCRFPGLAKDEEATITFNMKALSLPAGAVSGTIFHKAVVTLDETEFLPDEDVLINNSTYDQTSTKRAPIATDLSLVKDGPAGPLVAGTAVDMDYTFTVKNNGDLASNGAEVKDVLPAGLSFVSSPDCSNVAGTITCQVGSLAAGGSKVLNLKTRLDALYTGARPLVNTATLDAPGDPIPGNNTSSKTTELRLPPDGVTGIPTLSEWGLILLAGLLGLFALRRVPAAGRR